MIALCTLLGPAAGPRCAAGVMLGGDLPFLKKFLGLTEHSYIPSVHTLGNKGVRAVQNVSSFEEIIFVRRFRSKKIPSAVGLMGERQGRHHNTQRHTTARGTNNNADQTGTEQHDAQRNTAPHTQGKDTNQHHQQRKTYSTGGTARHHTATPHHRTQDTPQGSGAPQQTTAHSRAAGRAARLEQPRQHTPAENNSRQPDPATNSRQPQETTHSISRRERNNTAPPARHHADSTTPHNERPPEQRSTAPEGRTQPRATTGDQATATGGSSTGKEPSRTQVRHTASGKTQNTPRHRRKTGNNTHRTGTTRAWNRFFRYCQ